MVLSTEWSQVEVIDLFNDGSGLGFGIVGGRSTGVVIKSILPGGIADKDGRLLSGDHILQIGDVNLRGLTAEQVATVLRQAGQQVRMVVARSIEPSSIDFNTFNRSAPVVPTKILTDPEELDRQLIQNGYSTTFYQYTHALEVVKNELLQTEVENRINALNVSESAVFNDKNCVTSNGVSPIENKQLIVSPVAVDVECNSEPETEKFTVSLIKDEYGLGFPTWLTCWLNNYLSDRKQRPQVDHERTSTGSADSAVYAHSSETKEIFIEDDFEANPEDDLETVIKRKWQGIIGSGADIVVANLTKLKGLGISLEGTVDVEGGVELRPHHYIRSILPEGPVGQNGKLSPGDELLEVNGQKLMGMKHVEVVKILRELPSAVRLVCSREHKSNRVINTSQDREAFEARNILGGSLKNLLPQPEQKLIKALSDTSLNTSSTVTVTDEPSLQKAKSRSLEVTNVAMWSEEIEYVELVKTDRGLGFSILDYQDPMDAQSSVIVVRSLVPKGAAEQNGKITPGDRLVSVNGKVIKNASLDQAVQALKGTPPGVVKLGISKPLPSSRHTESLSSQTVGS
nr:patj homolog [Leptinotarsa decemlineata]